MSEAALEPIEEDWFRDSEAGYILAIGRLEAQKDYPTLLRAYAVLRRKSPVKLLILGEGSERSSLEALARGLGLSEDVKMPGYNRNPYRFLKKAKVFVLCSKYEGFGNVLLEAMACGTSIVSTDCSSGPSELLGGGKWGSLVKVGDSDALAGAIFDRLQNLGGIDCAARLNDFKLEDQLLQYMKVLGTH